MISFLFFFWFLIHFSKRIRLFMVIVNAKIKKKPKRYLPLVHHFFSSMFSFHFVVVCYIWKDIGHIKHVFPFVCVKTRSEWRSKRASERVSMHFVYTLSKDVCCVLIMYSCMSKSSAQVSLSMIVWWRFHCIIGCICTILYFFLLYSNIYIYSLV